MKQKNDIEVSIDRDFIVSKSNALVQKSRYELSVSEQRAICYICSKIKPQTDLEKLKKSPYVLEYEFDIQKYAEVCGLNSDSGRFYEETKALLKGLQQKIMWLELDDGTETTVNWVNKVWTNKRSGKAKIRLDEDMTPYLFNLQEKFTSYGLLNILAIKSQYSIRLYELLKSYTYQKTKNFDIDELKHRLMVDGIKSYINFKDFRVKVIEPAINEINQLTDLKVYFETITKGRKVIGMKFRMEQKDGYECLVSHSRVNSILEYPTKD